jgi:hypothetical protein
MYPALLPLMRTPRLSVVDWTDAPVDLNGLFAEKRNLVSARVPSHFKRSLQPRTLPKKVTWARAHNVDQQNSSQWICTWRWELLISVVEISMGFILVINKTVKIPTWAVCRILIWPTKGPQEILSTGFIKDTQHHKLYLPPILHTACIQLICVFSAGRDSVFGIVSRYGLDGPGIESRWEAWFSAPVQTGPGSPPASCTMVPSLFPRA